MSKKNLMIGGAMNASLETTLVIEQFLNDNYLFRRNVLNGKVEFSTKPAKGPADESDGGPQTPVFRPLTQEALNSIIRRAKKEGICEKGSPKTEIVEFVHSEDVPTYNPIGDYMKRLPAWDGQNHIAQLFSRLPGITSEQQGFLATWLRSAVAHWLQMDTLHGNECVPTLIGAQGCGKTTFFHRLLPTELREYYLDHLNLSNKFDKEMALTNNLLVNLDELHPPQSACGPEADALEEQGERTPHLWLCPGGSASFRFVRGNDQQSPPADGCHWQSPIHLSDDSRRPFHRQLG